MRGAKKEQLDSACNALSLYNQKASKVKVVRNDSDLHVAKRGESLKQDNEKNEVYY